MENLIFKPTQANFLRYHLVVSAPVIFLSVALTTFILGRAISHWSWQFTAVYWLSVAPAGVIGALLGQWIFMRKLVEHFSITVTQNHITGPSVWTWHKTDFALTALDKAKTGKQSLFQRLAGYRYIWSHDGKTIYLHEIALGKSQAEACLRRLEVID